MKKFWVSLAIATIIALAFYLYLAVPGYENLLTLQPGVAPNGEITSFPPYSAFIYALPFAIPLWIVSIVLISRSLKTGSHLWNKTSEPK
jgi:hypothetical protein